MFRICVLRVPHETMTQLASVGEHYGSELMQQALNTWLIDAGIMPGEVHVATDGFIQNQYGVWIPARFFIQNKKISLDDE